MTSFSGEQQHGKTYKENLVRTEYAPQDSKLEAQGARTRCAKGGVEGEVIAV
jgi:hypothetical protein